MLVLSIVLISVAALLTLVLLLSVGAEAVYDGGLRLRIKAGPFSFGMPGGREREPKPKIKKPPKEVKDRGKFPDFELLKGLINPGLRALGRLRRRIYVDYLAIRYTAAARDPYNAALQYGYISAAAGALWDALARVLTIEERELNLDVDFSTDTPTFYAHIILTIQIYQILTVALLLGLDYLRLQRSLRHRRRDAEREKNNGTKQQSDKRADGRNDGEDPRDGGREHRGRQPDYNA